MLLVPVGFFSEYCNWIYGVRYYSRARQFSFRKLASPVVGTILHFCSKFMPQLLRSSLSKLKSVSCASVQNAALRYFIPTAHFEVRSISLQLYSCLNHSPFLILLHLFCFTCLYHRGNTNFGIRILGLPYLDVA